jgi:zinc protease
MTSLLVPSTVSAQLHAPTIHQLPNGLTIIAEQMPVEAVNLSLWLNVGSAVESDEINGMAHFLEHMVFKGTETLQSGEFEQVIESRGAVTNAATSQDYTNYYITTAPSDFADLAPRQMDVVLNASIPSDGFERERLVVLEEIRRSQDNPRRRSYQYMAELAFAHLPYQRPVLGPTAVIETLTPDQMRDFHRTWYSAPAVTAVAVGNLPVDDLINTVAASWQASPAPARSRPPTRHPEPELPFTAIQRREFIDPTLQQARLMMIWRVPGITGLAQTYALDVIASILGHGRTARLIKDLREERGLANSIAASNISYQHQGIFCISAQLPVENVAAVEAAIAHHLHNLQTELVTPAELARVRTQVANQFIFSNETPSDRAGLYGYYHALCGDLAPAFSYPQRIQALTPADLQTAAQHYLPTAAYGIVVIKPA